MRRNGVPDLNVVSKRQMCLTSKRSRHQRSNGDCALRLGTPVPSRQRLMGYTIRPHGAGSRRTTTGSTTLSSRYARESIITALVGSGNVN
jgi:hypothetical protein